MFRDFEVGVVQYHKMRKMGLSIIVRFLIKSCVYKKGNLSSTYFNHPFTFKAHTHTTTFAASALESVLESAHSSSESANSNADAPVGM